MYKRQGLLTNTILHLFYFCDITALNFIINTYISSRYLLLLLLLLLMLLLLLLLLLLLMLLLLLLLVIG